MNVTSETDCHRRKIQFTERIQLPLSVNSVGCHYQKQPNCFSVLSQLIVWWSKHIKKKRQFLRNKIFKSISCSIAESIQNTGIRYFPRPNTAMGQGDSWKKFHEAFVYSLKNNKHSVWLQKIRLHLPCA